jgi:hypothetical protein
LSRSSLSRIVSSSPLYALVLTSGHAQIYLMKRSGASLVSATMAAPSPLDAARLAAQASRTPWVILVDQSEETFWGGVMPPLKGVAKTAWMNRMADQSGTDSPYRWSETQGKSNSHEGQVRVLGYTLGRPEALTPWLDALKSSQARIRGVYAPVLLLPKALKILKLTPSKGADDISVLVTPHPEGLRQTVSVGGRVRFSRLALHAEAEGSQWFQVVHAETAKLRDYLVGNGLLKSERTGMRIDCVLPHSASGVPAPLHSNTHAKDTYRWLDEVAPNHVYLTALAAAQPWSQLAPAHYRQRDLSDQIARALRLLSAVIVAAGLLYATSAALRLWQKQSDTQAAVAATTAATQRYQSIAKTFAKTPLTSAQLIQMSQRWESIQRQNPPEMREALVAAGQTLERHPAIALEEMMWDAQETPPQVAPVESKALNKAKGEKIEKATLTLRGTIRGIASDDLRGTRDALEKLEQDFNRRPNIRADITKRPLDLSAKSTVTGSGTQEKTELSFEIKLWQR